MHSSGWNLTRIDEVLERVTRPVKVETNVIYQEVGIRSHGKGIFHKPAINGKELGEKRVFWVVPNALMFNIVFAWEQAVAVTSTREQGMIASHRFPMYFPKDDRCSVEFLRQFFCTPRGKELLELASPGGAGRNKTLGQREFERISIAMPNLQEQEHISNAISTWNKAISVNEKLIANTTKLKAALIQKLMPQIRGRLKLPKG